MALNSFNVQSKSSAAWRCWYELVSSGVCQEEIKRIVSYCINHTVNEQHAEQGYSFMAACSGRIILISITNISCKAVLLSDKSLIHLEAWTLCTGENKTWDSCSSCCVVSRLMAAKVHSATSQLPDCAGLCTQGLNREAIRRPAAWVKSRLYGNLSPCFCAEVPLCCFVLVWTLSLLGAAGHVGIGSGKARLGVSPELKVLTQWGEHWHVKRLFAGCSSTTGSLQGGQKCLSRIQWWKKFSDHLLKYQYHM